MTEYIERNAFLESQIKRCNNFPPLTGTCAMDNVTLKSEIMKFPVADVEPVRRGEWLNTRDENKKVCSCCRIIHFIAQYPFGGKNYCPNCGAKMKGGKND